MSLFWAFMLPSVATSVYFYSKNTSTETPNEGAAAHHDGPKFQLESQPPVEPVTKVAVRWRDFSARRAVALLWSHFTESYSDATVVQWSVWWAVTMCGFNQAGAFLHHMQPAKLFYVSCLRHINI